MPAFSVFCRDDQGRDGQGTVFHAYSTCGRGVAVMMHPYALLDLTPKGRDEAALPFTMAWVRHHDRFETRPAIATQERPQAPARSCCSR